MQGTVLIADGVSTNRILLKAKLAPWAYDVVMAESGAELVRLARLHGPVLIVVSDDLPDTCAALLCTQIKADAALHHVPLIAIAHSDATEDRIALLRAGADEVFAQPMPDMVLQARVRSLIRMRTGAEELTMRDETARALGFAEAQAAFAPAANVAILTPDVATATWWRVALSDALPSARLASYCFRDRLSQVATDAVPDVFVIGLYGSTAPRGLRLLADLRANPDTRHARVLVIVDDCANPDLVADALDLGAGDLMVHGFDARELALRLRTQIAQKQTDDRLRASVQRDLHAALRDPMTGLFNRRYAMPYLTQVIERNLQSGRGFAVMVADLDHFKAVNDRYGHAAGDAVLTEAAKRLRSDLRAEDLIARVGGEEFLIVLPDSTREEAEFAAERLRNQVDQRPFLLPDTQESIRVTVSIGVAVCCFDCLNRNSASDNAQALLKLADTALYDSKGAGRNQVTLVNAG